MGMGAGSIQTAVEELLNSAEFEVTAVTYSITLGAEGFLAGIEACLERGIRVALIINRIDSQNTQAISTIKSMIARFPSFAVFDFVDPKGADLHSKLLVVDRIHAVVGSANLSWNGMVRNHELALLIDDPTDAAIIAETADRLFRSDIVTRIHSN